MFIFRKITNMTKQNQIYKCNICGNIVQVLHEAGGELVCCGKPMELKQENTQDAALEKHIPVVEKTDSGLKVKVGENEHPMDTDHYIEWIEIIRGDGRIIKKYFKPGDEPKLEMNCEISVKQARAYCNLHGLWVMAQVEIK